MVFKYSVKTAPIRRGEDIDGYESEEEEYYVPDQVVHEKIYELVFDDFFGTAVKGMSPEEKRAVFKSLVSFIEEYDIEYDLEERLSEELHEEFYDEAMQYFKGE